MDRGMREATESAATTKPMTMRRGHLADFVSAWALDHSKPSKARHLPDTSGKCRGSWLHAINDRFEDLGITGGADRERPLSTQLRRPAYRPPMAEEGQSAGVAFARSERRLSDTKAA